MTLDIVAVLIAIILTGFGYFTGALTQVTRIVGLVLAFIAAPVLASVYKELLFGASWPGGATLEWGVLILAGVSIYGGVSLLGFLVTRLMRTASDDLSDTDRALGAAIGFVKAAGVVYLLVSSMVLIQAPLTKADPDDQLHVRDSALLGLVQGQSSLFSWSLPDVGLLLDFLVAQGDRLEKLRDHPAGKRLLEDERVKKLLEDPEVTKAAEEGDVSRLMENPDVREVLASEKTMRALRQLPAQ